MLNKGILVVFFFIHGANNLFYFILFQCNVTNFQVRILFTFYFMLEKKTYLYFKYCLFIFIFYWIGEDQSDEWSGTGSCARQKGGSWSSAVRRDLGGSGRRWSRSESAPLLHFFVFRSSGTYWFFFFFRPSFCRSCLLELPLLLMMMGLLPSFSGGVNFMLAFDWIGFRIVWNFTFFLLAAFLVRLWFFFFATVNKCFW